MATAQTHAAEKFNARSIRLPPHKASPTMDIICPHCGNHLRAQPEWSGRTAICKSCKGRFVIPAPPSPEESEVHTEAPAAQSSEPPEEKLRSEKACPFCGESILAIARKCKHCGEFLDDSQKKPGKAIFKASSAFIGLLASYHIMDANKKVLAKMKPSESFEVAIPKGTVMYVKYAGGFGGPIEVKCHADEVNKFSITVSQSGLGCVVSRVDVIDSDA